MKFEAAHSGQLVEEAGAVVSSREVMGRVSYLE